MRNPRNSVAAGDGGGVCKTALLLPAPPPPPGDQPGGAPPVGEASGRHGAALVVDWDEGRLDVVYSDGSVPLGPLAALPAERRRALNQASAVAVAGGGGGAAAPPSGQGARPRLHLDGDGGCEGEEEEEEEGGVDVERRALDVSGCHFVGGRLTPPGGPAGGALEALTLRVFVDATLLEVFTSTGAQAFARARSVGLLGVHAHSALACCVGVGGCRRGAGGARVPRRGRALGRRRAPAGAAARHLWRGPQHARHVAGRAPHRAPLGAAASDDDGAVQGLLGGEGEGDLATRDLCLCLAAVVSCARAPDCGVLPEPHSLSWLPWFACSRAPRSPAGALRPFLVTLRAAVRPRALVAGAACT